MSNDRHSEERRRRLVSYQNILELDAGEVGELIFENRFGSTDYHVLQENGGYAGNRSGTVTAYIAGAVAASSAGDLSSTNIAASGTLTVGGASTLTGAASCQHPRRDRRDHADRPAQRQRWRSSLVAPPLPLLTRWAWASPTSTRHDRCDQRSLRGRWHPDPSRVAARLARSRPLYIDGRWPTMRRSRFRFPPRAAWVCSTSPR